MKKILNSTFLFVIITLLWLFGTPKSVFAYCGDRVCESNENPSTCPADCPQRPAGAAFVLGRVIDNQNRIWGRISCSGSLRASGMSISCNGVSARWACQSGAYYYTDPVFSNGQSVTCRLSGLPSGYQCSICVRSGTVSSSGTHWWFSIAPVPPTPTRTRTPTPRPPTPTRTRTPTPRPTATRTPTPRPSCRWCGDSLPCSGDRTCDSNGNCILLNRNQGDCDCDANCSGSLVCVEAGSTDYCCLASEIWAGTCTTPTTPIPTRTPTPSPTPTPVICAQPSISSSITCPDETVAGFRFTNLTIPQPASVAPRVLTITDARINLYSREWHDSLNLTISAEDTDNAANFSGSPPSARTQTSQQTSWSFTPGSGWQQSPNLASVIQEVVNRAGWSSGNSLNILINNNSSSGSLGVSAWDLSPAQAATLNLSYTISNPPNPPDNYSLGRQVAASADDSAANAGESSPSEPLTWPLLPLGGQSVTIDWYWTEVTDPLGGTIRYQFQVARDAGFSDLIIDRGWQTDYLEETTAGLEPSRAYYARVRTDNDCEQSEWNSTSRTPDCSGGGGDDDGACLSPPQPEDPPSAWCEESQVCIRWAWLPVEEATQYIVVVSDEDGNEISNSGWSLASAFPLIDGYHTYTTCNLNSDQIYRSLIGARGPCEFESWSDSTEYSHHCDPFSSLYYYPWYQTEDGDVHAEGDIVSNIPSSAEEPTYSLDGSGGSPGVVSYGGLTAHFGNGEISSTQWLSETPLPGRLYRYFYELLESPVIDNFDDLNDITADGLYYSSNAVVLENDFPAGFKAVVLVDGRVNVNTNIEVPFGDSLMVIAADNLRIDNGVSQIEGIFVTDGELNTGTGNTPLLGEGSFIADSFTFGRDFGDERNDFEPIEKFTYRPDLVINTLSRTWVSKHTWQEIAP